jgi:inner membrane protein
MDSLTQIVLGAACGEVVAGKKIGNRAMLWGAVGGTIPDLDVFAAFFTDEITATAFHRGFMHSFLFAVLAPWLLAWLCHWFYDGGVFRRRGYKAGAMLLWLLFYSGAAAGINFIPVLMGEGLRWYILAPTLALGGWLAFRLWRDYFRPELDTVEASYLIWVQLFFWSIFTHPILDCFTSWGTQIWQPFADTRVQWNTVSVVDPIATVPFALLLIAAAWFSRQQPLRARLNWLGLFWFCGYLAYTCWHKSTVNEALEQALQTRHIQWQRYMTGPTIFNNMVWNGLAEGDTAFYYSLYGFNDAQPGFDPFIVVPKHHELLQDIDPNDRAIRFLKWFSNGYFSVMPYPGGGDTLQVNDLRFGIQGRDLHDNNYVFPFLLFKTAAGHWEIRHQNRMRQDMNKNQKAFSDLWERVKGKQ